MPTRSSIKVTAETNSASAFCAFIQSSTAGVGAGRMVSEILRGYVEAMSGKLSLIVEFPDRAPVSLEGFGDTEEPPGRRAGGDASRA